MQSQRSLNNYNFYLGGMFDALFPPNKEILYDTLTMHLFTQCHNFQCLQNNPHTRLYICTYNRANL